MNSPMKNLIVVGKLGAGYKLKPLRMWAEFDFNTRLPEGHSEGEHLCTYKEAEEFLKKVDVL